MALTADQVAWAYRRACTLDVSAFKPGSVSMQAAGHGMVADDFLHSANATSAVIVRGDLSLGAAIRESARVTLEVAACNTNLGILLLCVPLAHAALACETDFDLARHVRIIIAAASIEDSQGVFDAIRLLTPAGLGASEQHDANEPADIELLELMRYGAARDRIAQQYDTGFQDVLVFGKNSCLRALQDNSGSCRKIDEAATVAVYLDFLCEFPDSHIARKHGARMAEVVRDEALTKRELYNSLDASVGSSSGSMESREEFLREFDGELKSRGINPGTSADLTVATLFALLLAEQWETNASPCEC